MTSTTPQITPPHTAKHPGHWPQTAGYYAAFVALGLIGALLGPTLTSLAQHTQVRLDQISILFTGRSLGYLVGSLLGGRLYDRRPGNPLMAGFLGIIFLMMLLSPLIPVLWLLFLAMLLMGFGEGGLDVGGNTMLMWLHREKVGPFMNGLHFAFGVGSFLTPIIIAQMTLLSGNFSWGFWIVALLLFPVIFWLLRLPSPTNLPISAENPAKRNNYLLIVMMVFFFALYVGSEVSFGGWVYTYAVAMKLMNTTTAALMTSLFWGSLTLGRLLSIPIASKYKLSSVVFLDVAGVLVSAGLILLWPKSEAIIWVGTFGTGFAMASIFPTMLSLAESRMHITGQVTSWFFVGGSCGSMALPWLIGQLFEPVGPRVVMVAILITMSLAMATLITLVTYSARTLEVS
ncbi:MAG: MFS transporter [Anaerolineaceae bacterium]|jgi:fucose permease